MITHSIPALGLMFGICAVAVCNHAFRPSNRKECKATISAERIVCLEEMSGSRRQTLHSQIDACRDANVEIFRYLTDAIGESG
ncbi:hypothetical protein BDR06DRAFT_964856 [Suillus hirtellus]|nr:hypothetical protein BDR06DRAFT_964856 [Suillus hirtellus]